MYSKSRSLAKRAFFKYGASSADNVHAIVISTRITGFSINTQLYEAWT